MESKRTCPECHLVFEAALPANGVLTCPLCNSPFAPHALTQTAPPVGEVSGRQVLRGVVAVAALALVAGGLVYAFHLKDSLDHKPHPHTEPTAKAPPPAAPPFPVETLTPLPPAEIRRPTSFSPPSRLHSVAAQDEVQRPLTLAERVNRAIDRGLAALRNVDRERNVPVRYYTLLGLTCLECGIPTDDASIQQIAAWVRTQARELSQTYDLTLAILFLDRLGDPRDRALIRTFGERLLAGQLDCGEWTYSCLVNERLNERRMARPNASGVPHIPSMPTWRNPSAVRDRPARQRIVYRGDNSNTQFAILGLWVAQRHGVASRAALLTTEEYFRATQLGDGSWAYRPLANNWRDSMTCAGLMSLAMRYGIANGRGRDIRSTQRVRVYDVAVQQGLRFLAHSLDNISRVGDTIVGVDARDSLYFLWSLERMAVIYDLKRIGKREWYPWAAELLVESQRADGLWRNLVDTCFALLILKRSNFAADLQLAIQEPPSRPLDEITGPKIVQGLDELAGQTSKKPTPPLMQGMTAAPASSPELGPSITRTPKKK